MARTTTVDGDDDDDSDLVVGGGCGCGLGRVGTAAAAQPQQVRFPRPRPLMMRRRAGMTSIRSVSTQEDKSSTSNNNKHDFAVQSIRRGSHEWAVLIQPFVADLAFRSLVTTGSSSAQPQQTLRFRPYTCQAAVLFVDISGYSKIAAALTDRGAHALSTAVNSYLSRLLHLVRQHGGDAVKFAGDAVLVVWEGGGGGGGGGDTEKEALLMLRRNVQCAARCVWEMQQQAGHHAVDGEPHTHTSTDQHVFRIHAALCAGTVESEIFVAPRHTQMQRLYHLVGGPAVETLSELVDVAKAGEICVDESCWEHLGDLATYQEIDGSVSLDSSEHSKLLVDLRIDPATVEALTDHIEETTLGRVERRSTKSMEEDFIHPVVLDLLGHGGMAPTQIAQMRDLVVLFIAMTSSGSPVNWLLEIQSVLDSSRCPLLQVVADDKVGCCGIV